MIFHLRNGQMNKKTPRGLCRGVPTKNVVSINCVYLSEKIPG